MHRIQILRNTYLIAYLQALRRLALNPTPLCQKYGIPVDFELIPEFMLAAPLLHRFIEEAAGCAAPGVLSSTAGFYNARQQQNPFSDRVGRSVSLADAIRQHNRHVEAYSPENRFNLLLEERHGIWRKKGISPSAETEIFCAANLIGHVRSLVGGQWLPERIEVSVADPAVLRALPSYRNVDTRPVPRGTNITIPIRRLMAPLRSFSEHGTHISRPELTNSADLDYLESLRLIMKSYARVGELSVYRIAKASGTSKRTLQRRLNGLGLSYSIVADQVRSEVAGALLINAPDLGITQIGYELGYRDPGSFSRAFRRVSGYTPVTYRRKFASDNATSEISKGTSFAHRTH